MMADGVTLSEVMAQLKARLLADAKLVAALQGEPDNPAMDRVYFVTESASQQPGGEERKPWGRVLLLNPVTGFEVVQPTGTPRRAGVLTVAETNGSFESAGYSPRSHHEAIQRHILRLVKNWAPATTAHAKCMIPFYVYVPFVGEPQWNEGRAVWSSSADYRAEFVNPTPQGM